MCHFPCIFSPRSLSTQTHGCNQTSQCFHGCIYFRISGRLWVYQEWDSRCLQRQNMEKENKVKKPRKQILIDVWTDSRCVFLWKSKTHPNKGKEKTGTNLPLQNTLNYIVPSKQVVIVKREMKKSNTIKHLETFRDKDLIKRTEKFLFTMLAA